MNRRAIELIEEFRRQAADPKKTIMEAMAANGKKAFGCFPIYVPEEIIYAAGLLPVGLWGGRTSLGNVDKYIQSFCCSIMRINMELGMKGTYDFLEGVMIPTFCDTMKAILANWKVAVKGCRAIPFVYPQNRESSGSFDFMLSQLAGFRKALEELTGTEVTDGSLEEAFSLYEEYRSAMRRFTRVAKNYPVTLDPKNRHMVIKAAYFQDKKDYLKKMNELLEALDGEPEEKTSGPRVVLTGLMAEPENFLDLFAENGYAVVADDLAQESRQFRVPARETGTALERMAYRVMDLKGCTYFYEGGKSRGKILKELVKDNDADAVVVSMMKFCDPDEFDYPVIKEELEDAGIPVLYLETELQMDSVEQLRTRIQSFAEINCDMR